MLIRNGHEADICEILQMIKDSYTPYDDLICDISIPTYTREEIHSLLNEPQSDVWVVEDNGNIVGMAAGTEFGPCAYHLKMLFVLGKSQYQGIGRELLKKEHEKDAFLYLQ
ncbi:GNAT family N-acetyltransferase [Butyrivibrio proteoclasticus]|uniref:GNAT family N-acetyltransferase n=1 Tax=Butyrivibrio proteoclasticus TaxID=43305 RepID=UPI00031D691A|nr:GNAT family N-acetyltransferase [Butyrivibrio proteoclasticus]